jgi:acetyltransferase EpsM
VLGVDEDAARLIADGCADAAVVGIGATSLRRRGELWDALGRAGAPRPALIHPRATVSPSCRIGAGSVVFPGCVLGADVEIGDNVVLYSGVIAEHGTRVGDHAYCSPGVVLSGAVVVERGAFLGSGAVVLPGLVVGAGSVVAAGAVVTADVPPGRTVLGVPAREAASA